MPFSNDPNLMRDIILDHYQYPRNKETPKDLENYLSIHMDSDSCIDDFHIYLKVENNIIKDVKYDGVGCTISTSSISIMTELLNGKTLEEAKEIINNYVAMVHHSGEYNEDLLDEANAFQNTYKQANRIKCATIGWTGVEKLIKESEEKK